VSENRSETEPPAVGGTNDTASDSRREIIPTSGNQGKRERFYTNDDLLREVEYFADGKKKDETNYRDGKQHGFYVSWYANGQMRVQDLYSDGRRNGAVLQWHPNGVKSYEAHDTNGVATCVYGSWYSNGQKEREATFEEGKEVGTSTTWDKNGEIIAQGKYRNGEPWEGTFESFRDKVYTYEQGKITATNTIPDYASRCTEPIFSGHTIDLMPDGKILLDDKPTSADKLLRDMGYCFIPSETAVVVRSREGVPENAVRAVEAIVREYPCEVMSSGNHEEK